MATKRKSRAVIEDSDDDDEFIVDEEPKKKAPPAKKSKASNSAGDDGADFFPLTAKRRVTVSEFRGKLQVDIREYYEADGEMKPGRKGICLPLDQWEKLKTLIPKIDEEVSSRK